MTSRFCGYSCLLYRGGGGKKKGFQYIFIELEFIRTNTHAHPLYFSRFRVQPSVKFLFSTRDVPRCVHGSVNFLNDPLKHFTFSSLFHVPHRLCFGSSAVFVLSPELSRNATTYYGLFSPSPSLSVHFEESFCISNSNSCKDSTCPTAARTFFDAARTVSMTFLVKFPLLLSAGIKSPQRILSELTQKDLLITISGNCLHLKFFVLLVKSVVIRK